jgi:hypothetical protein
MVMSEDELIVELEAAAHAYIAGLEQEQPAVRLAELRGRMDQMLSPWLLLKLIEAHSRAGQLQRSFDLRWKADRRATKMWQDAHPGNDLVWPDHADLVVWLLEQLIELKAESPTAAEPPHG